MKVWSITHDATGIRMSDGTTIRHWSNQTLLAESYAHLFSEVEQLRAIVGDVKKILGSPAEDMAKVVAEIDNAIHGGD